MLETARKDWLQSVENALYSLSPANVTWEQNSDIESSFERRKYESLVAEIAAGAIELLWL